MSIWEKLLPFNEPPSLSQLDMSYILAARDVKGLGVFVDILKINSTTYGAVNQRFSVNGSCNDQIMEFYWASSLEAVLQAAYGYSEATVEECYEPPQELLITPGCSTYTKVRNAAAERGLTCTEFLVRGQKLSSESYVGTSLRIGQLDFYFVNKSDDSTEMKVWAEERIAAIGIRTTRPMMLRGNDEHGQQPNSNRATGGMITDSNGLCSRSCRPIFAKLEGDENY